MNLELNINYPTGVLVLAGFNLPQNKLELIIIVKTAPKPNLVRGVKSTDRQTNKRHETTSKVFNKMQLR